MWAAVFVVLMIWKSVTNLQEENFVILDPAQKLASRRTSGPGRESRAGDAVGEILRIRLTRVVADRRRRLGVSRHHRFQRRPAAVIQGCILTNARTEKVTS